MPFEAVDNDPLDLGTSPIQPQGLIGWYGKLPFIGDFVAKNLPDSFVAPWDEWLRAGISQGREIHGDQWDELFLTFAPWRFITELPVGSGQFWCGILLPSIDRVGRQFPFTVTFRLALASASFDCATLDRADTVLDAIEPKLIQLLTDDDLPNFEGVITALSNESFFSEATEGQNAFGILGNSAKISDRVLKAAMIQLQRGAGGMSIWWLGANPKQLERAVQIDQSGLNDALFVHLVGSVE